MMRRGELLMVENAIKSGWNVSTESRNEAMQLANAILADPEATERERKRARSTLEVLQGRSTGGLI